MRQTEEQKVADLKLLCECLGLLHGEEISCTVEKVTDNGNPHNNMYIASGPNYHQKSENSRYLRNVLKEDVLNALRAF
jgi:hypothetical protein